jgi:hypothetical protein
MDHFKRSHQMGAEKGRGEEDAHIMDCRRGRQGNGGEGDTGSVVNRQSGGWRSELTARKSVRRSESWLRTADRGRPWMRSGRRGWGWSCGFRMTASARASRMSKKAAAPKKWRSRNNSAAAIFFFGMESPRASRT